MDEYLRIGAMALCISAYALGMLWTRDMLASRRARFDVGVALATALAGLFGAVVIATF